MKKFLTLLFAAAMLTVTVMAEETKNLFPLPTVQENRSLGENPGKWHRTLFDKATVEATMTVDDATGELKIERKGAAGYSEWRLILNNLPAGTYTLDTVVTADGKGLMDIYAFDAAGKPTLIYFKNVQDVKDVAICDVLNVPEGTVSVRFGFGVSNDATATYKMPRLFAGKLLPATLPAR